MALAPPKSDADLIDQLRRVVYAHFPARDIRAFGELLRRYADARRQVEGQDQSVPEGT